MAVKNREGRMILVFPYPGYLSAADEGRTWSPKGPSANMWLNWDASLSMLEPHAPRPQSF